MQLGEPIRGLMMNPHWRFVTADAFNVAQAVNDYHPDCRLAAHDETLQVAVAKFIHRAQLGELDEDDVEAPVDDRGGAWLLFFFPERDGAEMVGEPDSGIIDELRIRDMRWRTEGVDERQLLDDFTAMHEKMQKDVEEELAARTRERTGPRMRSMAKKMGYGWNTGRIFVPGVSGGG